MLITYTILLALIILAALICGIVIGIFVACLLTAGKDRYDS